jgi:hypothetical protein
MRLESGTSHGEEAMMSNRPRRWFEAARMFLSGYLLVGGASGGTFGQCETNGRPFRITHVESAGAGRVVVTWAPTRTNYIFGVLSADDFLGTNTQWVGRVGVWGDAGGTMIWTDATANVGHRFFRVVRVLPSDDSDWDGDGIPDAWETNYGLNPFDPGDATADPDGDGADNRTEYLQGRDPTRFAIPDTGGFVNLRIFTPLE